MEWDALIRRRAAASFVALDHDCCRRRPLFPIPLFVMPPDVVLYGREEVGGDCRKAEVPD
jgi:hypothetical protein